MIKQLIEKRAKALNDLKEINAKETIGAEERSKIDALKKEVSDLNTRIADMQFQDEQERQEVKNSFNKIERNTDDIVERTNSEFTKFLRGERVDDAFISSKGNFRFSTEYFHKRATVTKAGDSSKMTQTLTLPVDIIEKNLVLTKLGAPAVQFVSGGAFKAPYLSSAPAEYNSEDSSNADQTWTAGSIDMIPNHSSASYELSGTYLKSMSSQSVDYILASLMNRIYQGLEKKAIANIIANAAYSTSTTASTTYYAGVLDLEKNVEYMSGYLFNKTSGARAKQAKIDSGSGILVYKDNVVNGVSAAISSLFTGNTMIAGDFAHVSQVIFGDIEVNLMQDVAAKRKGNYILIADAFSDANVTNPIAFAKHTNTAGLSLS